MSYEKQTWNKYDELKTEEENIENGAVVTDNRMNHIENGIGDNDANLASHLADKNNPHKVTAAQVGLDKVDNVKQASKAEFDSHTSDASNPHKVTASQVGSYSKSESDDKLATQKQAMDSHVNNKANPHSVTASQVGAYSKQEIDTKVVHNTGDETISGKKTFSEVVDMPKFADSYVAFFANKGSGNTVTFTAPWDCTAEVELFYHGWGYSGGEWEIGITTPSGLTQIYEATGYTNGHNSQATAMPAKAIYSGLKKGQQYTFDKRDAGGRPGGSSRPMMIVKLYRN
ncbi:hypothetical protein [Lactococcus lactis]|uniref:hypothetical protein n=1 Tax=Lactococcus lactis TaxID=1358 RepID=UPI00072B5CFC|nr:hypothetical protein [Lactococcus lactis]KSU11107.1 YOMR protein [Lactococcus lactis subsp. lactis]MCT0052872.1 hypothetical protein [Lactococcus lactis subsp. lactis]